MINNRVERQLGAIDWDFPVKQKGLTSSPHWYPGTFPSQLPSAIIQALTLSNEIVFDPYGGSGTTAAEALRSGRKAWIADINPIGVLSSYSHCALILLKRYSAKKAQYFLDIIDSQLNTLPEDSLGLEFDINLDINELQRIDEFACSFMRPIPADLYKKIRKGEPQWKELEPWFHPESLKELEHIHSRLNEFSDSPFFRLFVEAMISCNLRAICSQNKSWGHIADNCFPKERTHKNVSIQLRNWLKRFGNNIRQTQIDGFEPMVGIQYWCSLHDWTKEGMPTTAPDSEPNIMITSPPYGDAIDYIYAQKLSIFYLGFNNLEIQELCNGEIGARRRRSKKDSRVIWANQIAESSVKHAKILKKGLMVTILPHKDHGREIGIKLMMEQLKKNDWKISFEMDRSICQKKTRQSWTSIKQETINIFAKE